MNNMSQYPSITLSVNSYYHALRIRNSLCVTSLGMGCLHASRARHMHADSRSNTKPDVLSKARSRLATGPYIRSLITSCWRVISDSYIGMSRELRHRKRKRKFHLNSNDSAITIWRLVRHTIAMAMTIVAPIPWIEIVLIGVGTPQPPPIPSSNPLNLDEREDFASNVDGEKISLSSQQRAEQTRQLNGGWEGG